MSDDTTKMILGDLMDRMRARAWSYLNEMQGGLPELMEQPLLKRLMDSAVLAGMRGYQAVVEEVAGGNLLELIALAQRAHSEGCECGWGGQHRDDCPQGAYEEAVRTPAVLLTALGH